MKTVLSPEWGRRILLTAVFVLLSATIGLIYLHPDHYKTLSDTSSFEEETKDEWYSETRDLMIEQEWQKARYSADKILINFPGDIFARHAIARCAMEQKEFATAEKLCRQLISEMPDNAIARNNLAVLQAFDYPTAAAAEIDIARKLLPDDQFIAYNHAIITAAASGKKISAKRPKKDPPPEMFIINLPKDSPLL